MLNMLYIHYILYWIETDKFSLPSITLWPTNHFAETKVIGDITKDSTLIPEYFKGVKKVINAVSVIVGPKEGDTPDRAKYSQVCSFTLVKIEILFFLINAYLS